MNVFTFPLKKSKLPRFTCVLCFFIIAQNSVFLEKTSAQISHSRDWQKITNDEQLDILYKFSDCFRPSKGIDKEMVYLKVKNVSSNRLKLEFKKELWYNGKCLTCKSESSEHYVSFEIEAGAEMEGSCLENSNKKLSIFSRMLNIDSKSFLTDFKLNDLKVTIIE